jgi:hypothetical protein
MRSLVPKSEKNARRILLIGDGLRNLETSLDKKNEMVDVQGARASGGALWHHADDHHCVYAHVHFG